MAFSLPPGVDRVVNEPYWFKVDEGFHKAVSSNWWIVKGGEKNSFSKFHVKEILETKIDDVIETTIRLEFFFQGPDMSEFEVNAREWELPLFDSSKRLIKWCLDFDTQSILDCSEDSWDLRLSVSNRRGLRRWRINVNEGAVGPLKTRDARVFQQAP